MGYAHASSVKIVSFVTKLTHLHDRNPERCEFDTRKLDHSLLSSVAEVMGVIDEHTIALMFNALAHVTYSTHPPTRLTPQS